MAVTMKTGAPVDTWPGWIGLKEVQARLAQGKNASGFALVLALGGTYGEIGVAEGHFVTQIGTPGFRYLIRSWRQAEAGPKARAARQRAGAAVARILRDACPSRSSWLCPSGRLSSSCWRTRLETWP